MVSDYYDLGGFGRPVSTASEEAQVWFDRGLVWCYGFNHEEAVRCFQRAVELDPDCAMAHWGIAYAIGPNYNKDWVAFDADELVDAVATAHAAVAKAVSLSDRADARGARADRGAATPVPRRHAGRGLRALERRLRRGHARGVRPVRGRSRRRHVVRRGAGGTHTVAAVGPPHRRAGRGRRHAGGAGRARAGHGRHRSAPPGSAAHLHPHDGDVAPPGAGDGRCRPAARAGARRRPPRAHADPHRRAVRAVSRRGQLERPGDRRRPQSIWSGRARSTSIRSIAVTTTTSRSTARCFWDSSSLRWRPPTS